MCDRSFDGDFGLASSLVLDFALPSVDLSDPLDLLRPRLPESLLPLLPFSLPAEFGRFTKTGVAPKALTCEAIACNCLLLWLYFSLNPESDSDADSASLAGFFAFFWSFLASWPLPAAPFLADVFKDNSSWSAFSAARLASSTSFMYSILSIRLLNAACVWD